MCILWISVHFIYLLYTSWLIVTEGDPKAPLSIAAKVR